MSLSLTDLINAAPAGATLALPDGDYDDPTPLTIRKDIKVTGSRGAVIHDEFQIGGGALVYFVGVTIQKNKEGAPGFTGDFLNTQSGHIVVHKGAEFDCDDCEITTTAGWTPKAAILSNGGNVTLRSMDAFSRVDWRLNKGTPIRLLYDAYGNFFGELNHPGDSNYAFNILSAADSGGGSQNVQGIQVVGSKMTFSGGALFNFGTAQIGIAAGRKSFVEIGGGFPTYVFNTSQSPNGWATPILLDETGSTKWVAPGCFG